jgi:hypothetical protein
VSRRLASMASAFRSPWSCSPPPWPRSDQAPFQRAGIPVGGLYTGDRDPCYHRPCDTLAHVNRPVLLGMAQATLRALRELAGG